MRALVFVCCVKCNKKYNIDITNTHVKSFMENGCNNCPPWLIRKSGQASKWISEKIVTGFSETFLAFSQEQVRGWHLRAAFETDLIGTFNNLTVVAGVLGWPHIALVLKLCRALSAHTTWMCGQLTVPSQTQSNTKWAGLGQRLTYIRVREPFAIIFHCALTRKNSTCTSKLVIYLPDIWPTQHWGTRCPGRSHPLTTSSLRPTPPARP